MSPKERKDPRKVINRDSTLRVKYGNEKKVTSKCKCQGHEAPKWANSEGMVSFKCIVRKRTILA